MSKEKKLIDQSPLVSIITPSYNSSEYIKETIESVLEQTYLNWEMIIIDDGSNDTSRDIIEKYTYKDIRIKILYNEKNKGASQSRNRGIETSKGEYIAFLDSDDIWSSFKLEKQIGVMQKENILMSYSSYYIIDEESKVVSTFIIDEKVTYNDLLKTSTIGTLTTIYNAQVLGKIYFENVGHEDYVMKLQILKKIEFAQGILEPLAKYRIVKKSLSSNKLKAASWQWYIYRKVEKLSFVRSVYYFLHYTYHGIFKYREK